MLSQWHSSVFPKTKNQLCIVYQIRNSCKFVPYKDRKTICADLQKIYRAVSLSVFNQICFEIISIISFIYIAFFLEFMILGFAGVVYFQRKFIGGPISQKGSFCNEAVLLSLLCCCPLFLNKQLLLEYPQAPLIPDHK